MLLTPLLALFVKNVSDSRNITFYFQIIFWLYGIVFIIDSIKTNRRLVIPKSIYFLALNILYQLFWSFFNGSFERRGILNILGNNVAISILFIILIIYNTKFNDKFINLTIKVMKITIIITAIVSVIQVFNPEFLNTVFYKDATIYKHSLYNIRRVSIFGYTPLGMGLSYIPLLSVLIGIYYFLKKKIPIYFLILGGISAFLTNTRYIMIAFIILSMQLFVVNRKKMKNIFKYILFSIILVLIIYYILGYLGYDFLDWYNIRLLAEGSIKETTRYKAIDNFIVFFPREPIFGTGVQLTDEILSASEAIGSSQIHVGYLSYLVSYGLVGSFFLFGFLYLMVKKLLITAKQTNYWGSFFAFLTFLWAQATLVHFSIFYYGLIFALVFDKYIQDRHKYNIGKEFLK